MAFVTDSGGTRVRWGAGTSVKYGHTVHTCW